MPQYVFKRRYFTNFRTYKSLHAVAVEIFDWIKDIDDDKLNDGVDYRKPIEKTLMDLNDLSHEIHARVINLTK